jgi:hypothetical protein
MLSTPRELRAVSDAGERRVRRNQVVQRWGTPDATVGSVNEPRTFEEHGVRANEKWIYRRKDDDPREPRERIIYWFRYDFVASYLLADDGTLQREDVAVFLAALDARVYDPDRAAPV